MLWTELNKWRQHQHDRCCEQNLLDGGDDDQYDFMYAHPAWYMYIYICIYIKLPVGHPPLCLALLMKIQQSPNPRIHHSTNSSIQESTNQKMKNLFFLKKNNIKKWEFKKSKNPRIQCQKGFLFILVVRVSRFCLILVLGGIEHAEINFECGFCQNIHLALKVWAPCFFVN